MSSIAFLYIVLAINSSTMLNKNGKSENCFLILEVRLNLSLLSMILIIASIDDLYQVMKFVFTISCHE